MRALTPIRRNVEKREPVPDRRDVFLWHAWDDRRGAAQELHDLLVHCLVMRRVAPSVPVFGLVFLLIVGGCSSKQTVCEHARERIVEDTDLQGKMAISDAPPDQRASAQEFADRVTEAVRAGFVEPCLKASEAEFECLSKIDPYLDAVIAANRGMLECSEKHDDDAFERKCAKWSKARDEAQSSYGADCVKAVERFANAALTKAGIYLVSPQKS